MKNMNVRVVDSISEAIEQIQNKIRIRAYEKLLSRGGEANRALDDWLDAERELICVLAANIAQQEDQIVAEIEISKIYLANLVIQVTTEEALIHAAIPEATEDVKSSRRIATSAFGVIRFDRPIDPQGVRAYYGRGVLRLTAPISNAKGFKASA